MPRAGRPESGASTGSRDSAGNPLPTDDNQNYICLHLEPSTVPCRPRCDPASGIQHSSLGLFSCHRKSSVGDQMSSVPLCPRKTKARGWLHSRWRAPPPHHPRLPHSPLDAAARLESSARQWPDDLEIARLGSMSIDEEQFRPLQKRVLRQMAPAIDASKHSIMYSIANSMRFVVFRVHNRYARRVDTAFAWMCRAVAEVKHSTAM